MIANGCADFFALFMLEAPVFLFRYSTNEQELIDVPRLALLLAESEKCKKKNDRKLI